MRRNMNREIKIKVGKNLKKARKAKNLKQYQIAKVLQTNQQGYSRYERGIIELDYYKIDKLCRLLDITPNDLFNF